jgi:tRNA nucleotidyltransferase/poly(A) polymerase
MTDSVTKQAATEIASRLHEAGHIAWFAGGCVRDELLHMQPKDYDIATDALPDVVQALFPRAIPVGAAFGVMLVRHLGVTVEVATFREESGYSDHRRPDSVRFSDAQHDAQRRDFTINGLFRDPLTGEVHDFVQGQRDLNGQMIRAIGCADDRLNEDHLRMLRAVRFATRLTYNIELDTEAAIKRHAPHLQGVSPERIGDEIRGLLRCQAGPRGAIMLEEYGLAAVMFGSTAESPECPRLCKSEGLPLPAQLAAWALDRGGSSMEPNATVQMWRTALSLSNKERDDMRSCLQAVERFRQWDSLGIAQRKRLAQEDWNTPCVAIMSAEDQTNADRIRRELEDLAATPIAPPRLLTGDQLVADGMNAGPDFGRVLEAVYDAQLEGAVTTSEAAIALARQLAGR